MAVADEAVGCNTSVAPVKGPQLPHILCTAAASHPLLQRAAGLQLEQIAAAGTEKALLAGVTEKNSDASYIDLLRLFKVRCLAAVGHSQRS